MKRRMLSWGLILSLLLPLLPVSAGAADHSGHTGWTQLSGTISSNSFYQDGNYYLNGNRTTYSDITINYDVTLCLNGHTLDMKTDTLTVSSGATLTICDCQSGGTITGTESHTNLNVISVEGGTLNLESGTISGTAAHSGSLISVTDGELNVTGGTISLNHTGSGAYDGVQAVKLSNSTGSFTGGEVSLTTAVNNARATTVYQEGGSVTVGGSAEIVFEWTTTEEKPNSAPGYGALCVTQNGSVTVKDNCTITASRTGGEMAGAVSIGTLNDATGTATITGGDINGFLVVYGEATIYNGSFAYIENRGTLTMTGGTVKNENENGINYGIWTSVTKGKTDLRNVTIKSATGIYVSTGLRPTIGEGVIINATEYGVDGSATLVGAPSISGNTADLYIYSMRATTDYPSVDATAYTGGALTVQERKFPDAHQGGYIGCAIKVPQEKQNLFSLENSDSDENFVYRYDTENSALRLYNQNAHPICGASCDHGNASHSNPAWQKWSTPSGYTLTGGSYYLTSTVTLSQPITITGDVNLCLNGNTIKRSDGSNPFQVTDGGSLTICDCKDTGKLTGGITATGGNIGIYGGTISGGAYAVDLGGNAKLTLAGSPALSGTSAALKLYTQGGTTLDDAAVDATDYTGGSLEVEENDVPGGANGFAIKGGENKFNLTNPSGGYRYAYESGGYVIRPDHTHSYTYNGNGSSITEECDCGHSATATISVPVDANLTYTGSAIEPAEVTYSEDWQGGNLTPAYENNINAGTATATITKDTATASVTFTIGKANQAAPTASDYTIDYANEKITYIASGCKVYTAQDAATEVHTGATVTPGTTYYIRREGDANHNPSGFTSFTVASRPAAPSVTAAAETIKGKSDGKVIGVDTTMEYSTDNGQTWMACTGNAITGLAAGTTVTVRVKATGSAPHGETASCTIGASTVTLTVTFEENGGSAVTDITGLSYNAAISAPDPAPTKTGYIFAGWYKESACTNPWNFGSDRVTANITLYAKWTANTATPYTVKHWQQKLNGGSEQNDTNYTLMDTESLTGTTGASVAPAVKPYNGFTAPGMQTVTIAADGSTVVNYYYTRNSYTVTLTAGSGIASVSGDGTYQYGETVNISATASPGYAWSQWSDGNIEQNRTFPMGAGNMTLTAQAAPISYTITYELGGGTASDNPTSYNVEGEAITLNNPTRTGYTFAGWTGTDIPGTSSTVTIAKGSTGDRTYTATWTANTYAIHYAGMDDAQHGENRPASHTYDTDTPVPNPTKDGYAFAGWLVNGAGDAVKDLTLSGTGYTADITLTAQWTLEAPTVNITGAPEDPVTYGTNITLTAVPNHSAGMTYTYQWYKDGTALSGKTESTLTLTDVADSGSYTVEVTASDGSLSSTVSSAPVEVQIKPLGIAVTWSGLTQVYGDNEQVKATLGGVLENDTCTLSAITYQQGDTAVATPANAGEYTAQTTLSGDDAVNYTLKNGTATLTIRPKTVSFTVTGNAVEGDDTAKAATVTPTDNTLAQTGYTVTYRQGTATVDAPTAVGSYEIWVEITDGNYQHTNGTADMQVGTLTITQAPPVLYDVTFAGGSEDATGTPPEAFSAVAGAKVILPACTFERTDYQFTGWGYGGKTYQPGDSFTMPGGNVTFTAQWQHTYGITVTVQEPNPEGGGTQEVSDAVVSLWLGANKLEEQTTTGNGNYTFAGLLPGIYNLVVTKGDRTVTSMVEITTENVTKNADLPKGATNSIVKVTEGSPDIVVGNLDTVFQQQPDETVYTEEDQKTVEAGGKVEFTFTADEKQTDDTAITEDLNKITAEKDAAVTLGLVMDYKLEKEVFTADGTEVDGASQTITQSTVLLEIRLPLPVELQGKASYSVYRVHDNVAEAMEANPGSNEEGFKVEGSSIIIYAQKFSTYAIGYMESGGNNNDNGNDNSNDNDSDNNQTGGGGGGGSSTPTYPPSIVQPDYGTVTVTPKNPHKGDTVTITPTPEEGYTVDTVTVTDASGKIVAVTPKDDGTYTFVQPTGKVTITVTFRPITTPADCPRDESCPMAPFLDADRTAWYHDGVHYCLETGLMLGTSATTFAPEQTTSRAMVATILWRLAGSPAADGTVRFADVPQDTWYTEAVRWADSAGVVTGYSPEKFGPNDPITREQLAAMLWRYAQAAGADMSVGQNTDLLSYTDASDISPWATEAMQWACDAGILNGTGDGSTLTPRGQATRAQSATMLMRFCQVYVDG